MRALVVVLLVAHTAMAQPKQVDPVTALPATPTAKLVVGTIPVAPFIIKNDDGSWGGISMDLWKEVARRLKLDYEIRELVPADLGDDAKVAALDVFVSLNVTAEREAQLDLTHAFYSTGLAIAVSPKPDDGVGATFKQIFTAKFGKLMLALLAMLAAVGGVIWLAERRRNEQFGGSAAHGIGAGLWWSAVTMTTVGYGDKAPVTLFGRILGLVWMFAAIIIIASFTAQISSALTVSSLESNISGPKDLPRVRVGTVKPSQGAVYLDKHHITYTGYASAGDAVDALGKGDLDAIVYEAPILRYAANSRPDAGVTVLDGTFDNHGYALALKQGSPLREAINLALLQYTTTDDWAAVIQRYLGGP
ncbi:MAG TPA: transporter substrate-binding domain-containing protein [Kofleriaceae bacterium]|nr:transporter substrate-binding domain-containing protein [Kofleriaceae bacterium]